MQAVVCNTDYINTEHTNTKLKRQEFFTRERSIKEVLDGMDFIYENDFSRVNPWAVTVAQLDDDEAIEIFVGAYRPTEFYKDNTRPYFLEFKDDVIVRQWTGSYLDHLCFSSASFEDDDLDGQSVLKLEETVLENGVLKEQKGEFTIVDFNPIRLKPEYKK